MNEINNLSELIQNTYLPIMRGSATVGEYRINSDVADRLAAHLVANDVIIRKHSAWIFVNDRCGCRECRNCLSYDGNGVILDLSHLSYCPWCGAKMDLG
jgi:hypothetical protein